MYEMATLVPAWSQINPKSVTTDGEIDCNQTDHDHDQNLPNQNHLYAQFLLHCFNDCSRSLRSKLFHFELIGTENGLEIRLI